MGDYFQSLADVEINEPDAAEAKSRLASWLVERQIICAELTDCVLGADGGHAPGANYAHAIGSDPGRINPPSLASNGVSISVGRQVHWGGELEAIICPRCMHREEMTPRDQGRWDTAFNAAINDWADGGAGLVDCLGCGVPLGLNDWDWGCPWAFATLGITVWNWDDLALDFIADIRELLGGHRLVYCTNKL